MATYQEKLLTFIWCRSFKKPITDILSEVFSFEIWEDLHPTLNHLKTWNLVMSELTLLKIEARELLAQVNQHFETSPNGRRINCSSWENEHVYNEMSFKEKVKMLRKKFYTLTSQNTPVKLWARLHYHRDGIGGVCCFITYRQITKRSFYGKLHTNIFHRHPICPIFSFRVPVTILFQMMQSRMRCNKTIINPREKWFTKSYCHIYITKLILQYQ